MKANLEIEVIPFIVPESVRLVAEQGAATSASMPLSALSATDLDRLCHEFRKGVFKCAGKSPPPEILPR